MVSREPLKLASGVRFVHSQPLKLAAGAIGSASDSDSEGSRFETWAASQVTRGYRPTGQGAGLRNLRSRFDPSYPYQVIGLSQ